MVLPRVPSEATAVCVRAIPGFKDGELCIRRASSVCSHLQVDKGYCLPIFYNLFEGLGQTVYIVVKLYANYNQEEAHHRVEAHWNDLNESVSTNSVDIENI